MNNANISSCNPFSIYYKKTGGTFSFVPQYGVKSDTQKLFASCLKLLQNAKGVWKQHIVCWKMPLDTYIYPMKQT